MKELREIKNRYEFKLDNRQVILIVSGFILVLMLSFLMGTLFGANLSKMDEPALASSVEAAPPAEPAPVVAAAAEIGEEQVSQPSERMISESSNSREDLIRELESWKIPTEVGDAAPLKPEPVLAMREEAVAPAAEPPAPQPEVKKAPVAPPVAPPAKAPAIEPVRAGAYTIQLASLPSQADAQSLVNDLRGKQYDAYMLTVSLPGKGTFYRVRVGHYRDLNQAKKALLIIQSREGKFFDAWVTQ